MVRTWKSVGGTVSPGVSMHHNDQRGKPLADIKDRNSTLIFIFRKESEWVTGLLKDTEGSQMKIRRKDACQMIWVNRLAKSSDMDWGKHECNSLKSFE